MKRDIFLTEFATIFGLPPNTLNGSEKLIELPEWDSMRPLQIIALADSKFGVLLEGIKIAQCETVGDIVKLLGDRIEG